MIILMKSLFPPVITNWWAYMAGWGGGGVVALTWVFTVLVQFSDWWILNASKWLLCSLIIGVGFVKLTAAVLIFFSASQTVLNSTPRMLGPRWSKNIMMEVLCWTTRCGCSSPYDNLFGSFFPVKTFMSRYFFIGHRTLAVDFTEHGCEQEHKTLKHLNSTYLSRSQEAC